jgi:Glycosyl transferases group 1
MSERTQHKLLAVLAPELSGHRLHWIEAIYSYAVKNGLEVCVFTCDRESIQQLSLNTKKNRINIFIENDTNKLIKQWGKHLNNRKMTGIVLEADKYLHKILFIRGKLRLLILRPYLEGFNASGLFRFLTKQLLILVINQRPSVMVARLSIPYSRRNGKSIKWVRDNFNTEEFLESAAKPTELLELSQIPDESRVITLPGYLQARKNPKKIYQTFIDMDKEGNRQNYLVFAGKQDEEFKAEILKIGKNERLIQIDRILTNDEFVGLIKRTDLIYLPYSNRGASGIVLNSLVIGTPVLLTGGANWRKLVRLLDGQLSLIKKSNEKNVQLIMTLLERPKVTQVKTLVEEDIPTVQNFFLGDF